MMTGLTDGADGTCSGLIPLRHCNILSQVIAGGGGSLSSRVVDGDGMF